MASERNLKYIFDRFYQEEDTGQTSGIGMAYVKKMVNLLEGTIDVKSKINKGTEVIFSIQNTAHKPMVQIFNSLITAEVDEKGKQSEVNYNEKEKDKTDAPRLLIVEDNYRMRKHQKSSKKKVPINMWYTFSLLPNMATKQ